MPATPNPFWPDRPVLVTGATGLLGSWLCEALVSRGAQVVALVRDLVPESLFHTGAAGGRCTTVFGDLRDGRLVERVLAEYEIDAVFHLGAQTIVEHALRDPANTMRSNVEGTWEVLDACRRSRRPTRIVVAPPTRPTAPSRPCPTRRITRSPGATPTTSPRAAPT
jgi:CDP-glucose 4,6-dehydratase